MSTQEKKKIYEEEIDPLIQQVIDLCEKNNMPVFVSCQINDQRDGKQGENTFFTSAYIPKDGAMNLQLCRELLVGDLGKELVELMNALGGLSPKYKDDLDEFLPYPKADKLN